MSDSVRWPRIAPSYPLLGNTPSSSLTLTATLLLALAVVGVIWLVRRRAKTWLLIVACTTAGALPTFAIGFLANRYLIDMLPPLVVAGAAGIWVVGDWQRSSTAARRAIRIGAVVLIVWGAWVNASLATWTLDQKSAGFTDLRYRVDGWIFPDPAPGLVVIVPDSAVPRDGVVGLDIDDADRCVGVYTAEQGVWVTVDGADTDTYVAPGDRPTDGTADDRNPAASDTAGSDTAETRSAAAASPPAS